jgi:hypothetical protein
MVFGCSSTSSFIARFSPGVRGYRSCLRPGLPAFGDTSGPVAVRHLIKKDESIKEILDNAVSDLMAKVSERYYGGDESKILAIDYLGVMPAPASSLLGAHVLWTGDEVKPTPPVSLPSSEH